MQRRCRRIVRIAEEPAPSLCVAYRRLRPLTLVRGARGCREVTVRNIDGYFNKRVHEKNPRPKSTLRREIEVLTKQFLDDGGKITKCDNSRHYDNEQDWRWGRGGKRQEVKK